MAVPISNVTRRQVYAPSGSGGAGPYAFTFEILANTDIAVFKDDVLLTLTTHYTVVINANGTGSATITAAGLALSPVSPTRYAIVGNRTIARATDFTTGGDFFANTLNDELDQQTIFAQQNAEGVARALQAPQTDPTTINMTLPKASSRANKTLAFDANGNPTLGISTADVANAVTYATNAANSATAAASSASSASSSASSATSSASTATTQASNASTSASGASTSASGASTSASNASTSASTATTQAGIATTQATNAASSASAASTSASNASTSATNAASAQTAAESARDQTLASFDSFDDRYLGTKTSNPTLDNDGNALLAGALYFNSVTGVMNVYTGSLWVAAYVSGTGFLASSSNLSDVANTTTARTNISAAKSGANSDITSLTGLTTALSETQGGTGTTVGYNGFKNRIINGAMVIDQRNAGASITPTDTSNRIYALDRWCTRQSQASKFSIQQSSTAPTGFINSSLVTSLSAYSITSSDQFVFIQIVEGLNASDLAWGTANAATVTLSFQVRSSLTGTFGGSLRNSAADRSYPFSYTINAANTFETKTVTIAGDTSGTWLTTNGIGVVVGFGLGVGSTLSGTAGAWAAANYASATGAVSVVGTSGATFYITGVQLEKGSTATSFDYRPYGTELMLCQRYYQLLSNFTASGNSTVQIAGTAPFQATMRGAPAAAVQGVISISDGTTDHTQSSGNITVLNSDSASVIFLLGNYTSITANRPYFGYRLSPNTNKITLSAEL